MNLNNRHKANYLSCKVYSL